MLFVRRLYWFTEEQKDFFTFFEKKKRNQGVGREIVKQERCNKEGGTRKVHTDVCVHFFKERKLWWIKIHRAIWYWFTFFWEIYICLTLDSQRFSVDKKVRFLEGQRDFPSRSNSIGKRKISFTHFTLHNPSPHIKNLSFVVQCKDENLITRNLTFVCWKHTF